MDPSKASITDTLEQSFFMNYSFRVFVTIAAEAILANAQNACFPEEKHETINAKIHDPLIFVQTELML